MPRAQPVPLRPAAEAASTQRPRRTRPRLVAIRVLRRRRPPIPPQTAPTWNRPSSSGPDGCAGLRPNCGNGRRRAPTSGFPASSPSFRDYPWTRRTLLCAPLEIAGEKVVGAGTAAFVNLRGDGADPGAVGVEGREAVFGLFRDRRLKRAEHRRADEERNLHRLVVAPEPDRETRRVIAPGAVREGGVRARLAFSAEQASRRKPEPQPSQLRCRGSLPSRPFRQK